MRSTSVNSWRRGRSASRSKRSRGGDWRRWEAGSVLNGPLIHFLLLNLLRTTSVHFNLVCKVQKNGLICNFSYTLPVLCVMAQEMCAVFQYPSEQLDYDHSTGRLPNTFRPAEFFKHERYFCVLWCWVFSVGEQAEDPQGWIGLPGWASTSHSVHQPPDVPLSGCSVLFLSEGPHSALLHAKKKSNTSYTATLWWRRIACWGDSLNFHLCSRSNNGERESSENSRRESRGDAMKRWSSWGERRRGGTLRESRYRSTHIGSTYK